MDRCGLFAIFNNNTDVLQTAESIYYGLFSMQHRGMEAAGICINQNGRFKYKKEEGLVIDIFDAQTLAADCPDLEALADHLAGQYAVVTVTEVGGGVVPTDPAQRAAREAAGRLGCLLAARANTVVRVFCGLPLVLKGDLPQ